MPRIPRKPYPTMGEWVVLLNYDGEWSPYAGATTEERARRRRRELPQWPDRLVAIFHNVPGADLPPIER